LLNWCRQQGVEAEATPALLAGLRPLRAALVAWQPAAASLHYPGYLSLTDILAVRWAGVRHCTVTIHSIPESLSLKQRMMMWLASRLVDAVIVHSRLAGQGSIKAGVPARKIVHIPLGIHLPEERPTRAAARERLGLPADAFIIGAHARLEEGKGLARLIETVGHLPAGADGPYLLIAGDGPQREELAAQAQAALGERVRFLGQLSKEDFPAFYAALDVFALAPVVPEAFGMVYIEAAQFGVPSVSWRMGGIGEAVLDGETGLLVEAHDLAGLEQNLTRLRADPALRACLGERARTRALTKFTEAHMAEEYARVLRLAPDVTTRQDERVPAAAREG
jgi:glycosyltransferase involved in cell wall biosynthesis